MICPRCRINKKKAALKPHLSKCVSGKPSVMDQYNQCKSSSGMEDNKNKKVI